jgi:hypothetical protein
MAGVDPIWVALKKLLEIIEDVEPCNYATKQPGNFVQHYAVVF